MCYTRNSLDPEERDNYSFKSELVNVPCWERTCVLTTTTAWSAQYASVPAPNNKICKWSFERKISVVLRNRNSIYMPNVYIQSSLFQNKWMPKNAQIEPPRRCQKKSSQPKSMLMSICAFGAIFSSSDVITRRMRIMVCVCMCACVRARAPRVLNQCRF